MVKMKLSIVLFIILIFTGSIFAQQIQIVPIAPQSQSSINLSQPSIQGQQPILQQLIPQTVQPAPVQPAVEKPSEFEQYVSGKIEITDTQFEILKKYEGIFFS
ncbi:MAG: hypothetical protein HZC11_09075, partial [Nitrospirae bacterium]|nr:hypothetical protein [Nitrospirota bacterium]